MGVVNETHAGPPAQPACPHVALTAASIGALALRNRVLVAPMSRVSAGPAGVPTAQMATYYGTFAAGGFAAVISEGIYTDTRFAQSYAHQPGLVTDDQQHGWAEVTRTVHAAGGAIFAQLMHAGALSQCLDSTAGPSSVAPLGAKMPDYGGTGAFALPSSMSPAQIAEAIDGFAAAAVRARAAGFDGVEIHAANGYLLDQFITRYTNTRTDSYGASSANRIRLTAEVIAAIRACVPADFIVGVRLSQTKVNDVTYRWSSRSEATVYFTAVAEAGADYVHVASEGRNWHETAMIEPGLSITALARAVTGLPVIANGGMHDPDQAAEILNGGHADLISLATGALANPDWPERLVHGRAIQPFDHRILHPAANLDNAERFTAGPNIADGRG